ncbi:MAG TPA: hypothetical protein VLD58_05675, partial [Gemmatimonadales bacterium]|nr:hypothetical protein [Gemmatimonadales bacterium]
ICQAGADALVLFLPVEAALVGGGNPVPGTASALGQFGRFRLAGRIGLVQLTIPDASFDGTSDTVSADKRLLIPMPRLDLDVGIFSRKLPVGTASVDLLGSAVIVPIGASSRYRLDPNARRIGDLALGLGFGLRAAMAMAGRKPTVSLNVMKRDMPAIIFGNLANGDQLSASTTLSVINARLLVGGHLGPLELTGGGGIDLIKGKGRVAFHDPVAGTDSSIALALSTSRINTLLNASLIVGPLKLWGEGGFLVGKDEGVLTTFERIDPAGGQFYGGVGVALGF